MNMLKIAASVAAIAALAACGSADADTDGGLSTTETTETDWVDVDAQMVAELEALGLGGSVSMLAERGPEVCRNLAEAADGGMLTERLEWEHGMNNIAIAAYETAPVDEQDRVGRRVTTIQIEAYCPEMISNRYESEKD